ncbi:glycosyltransferase [Neosynechococcus sphagnicola]|uniref:glycosyltransferase n=1 Tax=Neosynechococcus sphagnicola TaxID=1501145 RepID=UPI000B1F72CD|nr:glycosyltransferase [Neosynechococcus sphagnicola]
MKWQAALSPLCMGTRRVGRGCKQWGAHQITDRWTPYSRLLLVSDSPQWVLSWELRELAGIARLLGAQVVQHPWLLSAPHQAIFYGSQFVLANADWRQLPQRVGLAYFHGLPGTGVPEFDQCYQQLCQFHPEIARIQVSHRAMQEVVLSSGIAPEKVFRIPIGINLDYFPVQTSESRRRMRAKYGLPETAVVVGSFQKDGVGWGAGLEPKRIKGPDVFLQTIERLKSRIPDLWVLLSGPARGYVKAGLERLGVPYRHCLLNYYPDIGQLFQTLDLYIVASRQEGGPKAVLESMASGVPLVTTQVGQAMDLVQHGANGWMVAVEDVEALAHWAEVAIAQRSALPSLLHQGRLTAVANSYTAQVPLWRNLLEGFVAIHPPH